MNFIALKRWEIISWVNLWAMSDRSSRSMADKTNLEQLIAPWVTIRTRKFDLTDVIKKSVASLDTDSNQDSSIIYSRRPACCSMTCSIVGSFQIVEESILFLKISSIDLSRRIDWHVRTVSNDNAVFKKYWLTFVWSQSSRDTSYHPIIVGEEVKSMT